MRVYSVIILIFVGFLGLVAQKPKETSRSKNDLEVEIAPVVEILEDDSLIELLEEYDYLAHYGDFVDFAPDVEDSVIIARIAAIGSDIPLRFDNKIRGFIDYFSIRNRDYTRKMIQRSQVYFPIIEEILAKNNMPESLKYLAIVESGLDPKIKSWAGAMGLWQFMPATGKSFSLNYDYYIDERQNPYKSTEAACRYLKDLYRMFGDWELALGAYNCGPGNMRKAIRNSGGKTTFVEIYDYLPKETRSYVPQFMAVNYVVRYATEHNLYVEPWESEYLPESDTIILNQYVDLAKLCELTGICSAHFVKLNPEIKGNTISDQWRNYPLVIPKELSALGRDSMQALLTKASVRSEEEKNNASFSTTSKVTHKVRSGESLGLIANKYGTTVSNIKKWNNLRSSTIYPGQKLTVMVTTVVKPSNPQSVAEAKKEAVEPQKKSKPELIVDGDKMIYVVKSGDFLGTIASDNHTTISELKTLNNLKSDVIHVGQKLIISQKTSPADEKTSQNTTQEKIYYIVKSGDVLSTIATKNGSTVAKIKEWNGLTSNTIKVGQKLIVGYKTVPQASNPVIQKEQIVDKPKTTNTSTVEKVPVPVKSEPKATENIAVIEPKTEQKAIENKTNTETKPDVKETPKNNSVKIEEIKPTIPYVVQTGESLFSVSKKFNMTVAELKTLNNINSDALDSGQKIQVYSSSTTTKLSESISSSQVYSGKTYTVQSGDTLWSISKKFDGLTIDEIKKLNNLSDNELKVGQVLKLG